MGEFIKMECRKKPEEENQNRGEHKLLKIEAFFILFMSVKQIFGQNNIVSEGIDRENK